MRDTKRPSAAEWELAEYPALRDEMMKRTEIQHQLITLAIGAAGILAGITTSRELNARVALLYAPLGLLLFLSYGYHHTRVTEIGQYLFEKEKPIGLEGWETRFRQLRLQKGSTRRYVARGMFVVLQVLTLLVALAYPEPKPEPIYYILLSVSVSCLIATLVIPENIAPRTAGTSPTQDGASGHHWS